jgi:hypothetical protein
VAPIEDGACGTTVIEWSVDGSLFWGDGQLCELLNGRKRLLVKREEDNGTQIIGLSVGV